MRYCEANCTINRSAYGWLATRTKTNPQNFKRSDKSAKDASSQPGLVPFRKGCQAHAQPLLLSFTPLPPTGCITSARKFAKHLRQVTSGPPRKHLLARNSPAFSGLRPLFLRSAWGSPPRARLLPPGQRIPEPRPPLLCPAGDAGTTPGVAEAKQCADSAARFEVSARLNLFSSEKRVGGGVRGWG